MQIFRSGWFLSVCIMVLALANVSVYRAARAPLALEVSVLDIGGKGGAALVRAQSGRTILVNAGPDAGILRALGGALSPWRKSIDAVVLTGTKPALIGGLPAVESRYRISARICYGGTRLPYGAALALDGVRIVATSPNVFSVSSGTFSLLVSSTTPIGIYAPTGTAFARIK